VGCWRRSSREHITRCRGPRLRGIRGTISEPMGAGLRRAAPRTMRHCATTSGANPRFVWLHRVCLTYACEGVADPLVICVANTMLSYGTGTLRLHAHRPWRRHVVALCTPWQTNMALSLSGRLRAPSVLTRTRPRLRRGARSGCGAWARLQRGGSYHAPVTRYLGTGHADE
jgi:hypothetical protein